MAVAMVMEAEEDAAASAAGENRISAAVAMPAELVVTTAEPGAVGLAAAMARGLTHPESQRKATVAMHREARPEGRFMVLARDRKIEPLPSSLHGLQIGLELTTFPVIKSGVGFARKSSTQQRAGTPAKGATRPDRAWSRQKAANRQRLDPQTKQRLRNWQGKAPGWNDAKHNHQEHWRDRHHPGHDWWRNHCDAIVLVNSGFWGWYDGWWYPAWGYDPYYSYYDYNGPIYGYDGLQPDEVIANVQSALQQLGYYSYAVDGVLGPTTESAIANYQGDYGVRVTGAIDPATVGSLGLSS